MLGPYGWHRPESSFLKQRLVEVFIQRSLARKAEVDMGDVVIRTPTPLGTSYSLRSEAVPPKKASNASIDEPDYPPHDVSTDDEDDDPWAEDSGWGEDDDEFEEDISMDDEITRLETENGTLRKKNEYLVKLYTQQTQFANNGADAIDELNEEVDKLRQENENLVKLHSEQAQRAHGMERELSKALVRNGDLHLEIENLRACSNKTVVDVCAELRDRERVILGMRDTIDCLKDDCFHACERLSGARDELKDLRRSRKIWEENYKRAVDCSHEYRGKLRGKEAELAKTGLDLLKVRDAVRRHKQGIQVSQGFGGFTKPDADLWKEVLGG